MKLHDHFEWDPRKAETNRRRHEVTFDDAAAVLADEEGDVRHLEYSDDEHSYGEDRFVSIGSHPDDRSIVLSISWGDRSTAADRITRIISARVAASQERKRYAKEIADRLAGG
jgi:uncharacterized DUF497 family protein